MLPPEGAGSVASYTYEVSLRVWHPSAPPAAISSALSMTPRTSAAAGDTKGAGPARHDTTYWSAVLHHEPEMLLSGCLEAAARRLEPHAVFLRSVRAEGGRVEIFVGIFLNRQAGELVPHTLMARLGALGIDLALDMYGPNAPDNP